MKALNYKEAKGTYETIKAICDKYKGFVSYYIEEAIETVADCTAIANNYSFDIGATDKEAEICLYRVHGDNKHFIEGIVIFTLNSNGIIVKTEYYEPYDK